MDDDQDAVIERVLNETRTIALIGASDRPERAAHEVMGVLIAHGYRVIPVNPQLAGQVIMGQVVVARLADIGEPIDMVDVFRRSEFVAEVVDDAIAVGAKAVWTQIGVSDADAAARAREAGLLVVMDRCPKIELRRRGIAAR